MCGIAGFVGARELPPGRIDQTLALMRRRGPDHQAHAHFTGPDGRQVHLLHARLRILDLDERSNQPFRLGNTFMVFNGEVYNYLELRRELSERGQSFRTTSDTEVLQAALTELGAGPALDRAEGMWAFARWDADSGTLLLARDRFGEKPLYLMRDADGLYFASEVKFLAALAGRRLTASHDHLKRYLVNGYKALYKQPHAFFHEVSELPAASYLSIGPAGEEAVRYWQPRLVPDETMSEEEAIAGTRQRLIRSVELRLRADVPLAFCMSGGVDSNALISIAKRVLGYDVHGFTIVNTDQRYEESDLVSEAVHALQLRHTAIAPRTAGFLPKLRTLVRQHDAPVSTITYYAHWLLMESIAEHGYRIAVSGTAADELFSGYYDHYLAYLAEVAGDGERHAAALAAWEEHVRPVVRNPLLSDPDLFRRDPTFRDHIFLDAEGFAAYLREPWSERFAEAAFVPDLLRNRMLNEMFHEAVPVILHEDDHNAMYYSIENRSPFLDRELFEWASRIPTRHLMKHGYAKWVLRESMRGIVPTAILDSRRKVGFNAPIFDFLDRHQDETRAQLLDESPIFELVHRDKIERLLRAEFLPNSQSKFLFYFLCAKMFLEELGT